MTRTIALVVPSMANTAGVTAVAEFIMRAVLDQSDYRLKAISLATAARDADSVLLTSPRSWFRGVTTSAGDFRGTPFTHVGACCAEIETQRLKQRAALTRELADVDLIQVVCGAPAWARPVIGLGVPVCLQVATLVGVERATRDAELTGVSGVWRRMMTRQVTRMESPALRAVDCVQVENPWMYAHAEQATSGSGTEVVMAPPGVDDTLFQPADMRPNGPGYLLAVGRMSDPRKNHMLLLETYRRLHAELAEPPRLVLAGATGPTEMFRKKAQELRLEDWIDVHLKPSKPDLAALYRGARAFALTSDEEGFGVTLVEAMASGTPPVSTRSGGPDGILTHGMDGFLADCGDAEGLARHLAPLFTDDALNLRISKAARHTVMDRYSARAAGQVFLDIYHRLLTPDGAGRSV
ncbi:MAG: glycosyltransferase family 4 protein [Paracoccaceae bacterium]